LKYLSIFIYPVSIVVSIIFCVLNLGWLLKSNKNNDKEYKHKSTTEPVWRSCDPLSSIYNFCGTIIYLWIGFFLASALSLSPIPALISFMCLLTPLFMKAKIVETDSESGEKKDMKDNPIYGFRSSINGLIESKLDVFMFLFCVFTTYATYMNSTDIKAPIFVGLASIWFLYRMVKHKEPPAMSTPDLASYERNEKVCPEKKLSEAELAAMARDEEEDDATSKEAKKNSYISQIIAFWISVWLWLPKTIYNLWLKVYDSLFGPDKPCPAGGEAQPQPQPEPEPEPQPQSESPPQSEPTNVEIAQPVPQEVQLNEQPISPLESSTQSIEQPVASQETPEAIEQPKTGLHGGGRRKDELLRKIKNLTKSLKRRRS
jgi:outer membrane biosynthesis protein TonB